jgi:hypothetical protein
MVIGSSQTVAAQDLSGWTLLSADNGAPKRLANDLNRY